MAILGPNSLVQPFTAELEQPQLSQPALPVVWSASSGHIIADFCVRCCKTFEFVDYGRESLSLESPPTRMISLSSGALLTAPFSHGVCLLSF